jgi:hypothetical protein
VIGDRTGWSIRKFVRTARRYRTVHIRAGQHLLTAEDPLPADLREALARSPARRCALSLDPQKSCVSDLGIS